MTKILEIKMAEPKYIINLKYRIGVFPVVRRVEQRREFYDGITKTIFKTKKEAKKFFDYAIKSKMLKMNEANVTSLDGNCVEEISKGEIAETLYEHFKKGLDIKQKGMKISYKIVQGGET